MKKIIALISLSLALVGGASATTTYTDVNPANVILDSNAGPWWLPNPFYNPSYTGNFTLAGYNSTLEEIVSAEVSFRLFDAVLLGGSESYLVTLSLGDIVGSGNSFKGFLNFDYELPLGGTALLSLSENGALSYTVTATSGSFLLSEATITANSELRVIEQPQSVPETGTTFVLMGAALLGLAAVRRKIRA